MREPKQWTEREWQAVEAFAGFIEREARGEDVSFEVLLEGHPDLRDDLNRLRRGRRTLLRTVEYRRGGGRRPSKGSSAATTALFAILLSAFSVVAWRVMTRPEPAVVDAATRFIEAGWNLSASVRRATSSGGVASSALDDECVDSLAMFHAVRVELDQKRLASGTERDPNYSQALRSLESRFTDEQRLRFERIVEGTHEWPDTVAADLSVVAASVAEVPEESLSSLPTLARSLYERLRPHRSLALKVIDLDHGGIEIREVDVYAQAVDPFTGALASFRYVGAPPVVSGLPAGDVRLTVFDRATTRFSELRVLNRPGEQAQRQLMFLRSTSRVTADMIAIPASDMLFGRPPNRNRPVLHFPGRVEPVPSFWIDRREVSYGEYGEFLADLNAHPSWFEFEDGTHIAPVSAVQPFRSDGMLELHVPSDHAVTRVTWSEAVLFANWAGKRLATEREWEVAAEGPASATRDYPWGDVFERRRVTPLSSSEKFWNVPVDGEPSGATPLGIVRMSDGVSEWVEDICVVPAEFPGAPLFAFQARDGRLSLSRVVRGAASDSLGSHRCLSDTRAAAHAEARSASIGFRCAKSLLLNPRSPPLSH